MPRTFFGGTYMVPDPPDFNWEPLERASGLTFTEPQRDRLIDAMHRYLRQLTLQRVMVPTKDVKQQCERIYKQAYTLRQLLSLRLKNAPSDEYQINLQQAVFSLFPYPVDRDAYVHALIELEVGAKQALRSLREQGQPGRQDKEGLDVMIRAWQAVYREAGGIGSGCTRSGGADNKAKARGPFLDLLHVAFQQILAQAPHSPLKDDIPPTRDALAQRILSALRPPRTPSA
jgi:hypothetical protein